MSCPSPLVVAENQNSSTIIPGTSCAFPCPSFQYNANDNTAADVIMLVNSTISFVLTLFLLVSWLILPSKRNQYMILYFNAIMFVLSSMLFINSIGKKTGVFSATGCVNNSESIDQNNYSTAKGGYWCIGSAIIFTFCTFAAANWWSLISLELFFKLVLQRTQPSTCRSLLYHLYGFGVPILVTVLCGVFKAYGSSGGNLAWCTIEAPAATIADISLTIFYFPLLIPILLATITMIFTLAFLCKSANQLNRSGQLGNRQNILLKYLRPLLFLLLFLFLFAFLFVYRLYIKKISGEWEKSAAQWIMCHLFSKNTSNYSINCGDSLSSQPFSPPAASTWLLGHFIFSAAGIFTFIIYGTQQNLYITWAKLLWQRCGLRMCRKLAREQYLNGQNYDHFERNTIGRGSLPRRIAITGANASQLVGADKSQQHNHQHNDTLQPEEILGENGHLTAETNDFPETNSVVARDYSVVTSSVKVLRDAVMEPIPQALPSNYSFYSNRASSEGYHVTFNQAAIPSNYEYKQYQLYNHANNEAAEGNSQEIVLNLDEENTHAEEGKEIVAELPIIAKPPPPPLPTTARPPPLPFAAPILPAIALYPVPSEARGSLKSHRQSTTVASSAAAAAEISKPSGAAHSNNSSIDSSGSKNPVIIINGRKRSSTPNPMSILQQLNSNTYGKG
jgi:hypothetical protein